MEEECKTKSSENNLIHSSNIQSPILGSLFTSTDCLATCQQHYSKQKQASKFPISPKTPHTSPDSQYTNKYLEDDLDSVPSTSIANQNSTALCEHPHVAKNGTTFSGSKMKYMMHSSKFSRQIGSDYLTPTQRAQQQIRKLRELLNAARQNLTEKNSEILRLTSELVDLRILKASVISSEYHSSNLKAHDAQKPSATPIVATKIIPQQSYQQTLANMQGSFTDSGHFEDLVSTSSQYEETGAVNTYWNNKQGDGIRVHAHDNCELERQELIRLYEKRIEDLTSQQDSATENLKSLHNEHVEKLLGKLSDCNIRYADIIPNYEHAKERIRDLEKQLENLQQKLSDYEEKQKKIYLHIFQKGQEQETIVQIDQVLESSYKITSNNLSINELLHQLQVTQLELENIREAECQDECDNKSVLLSTREAISLWVLGAWKAIYRRLLETKNNQTPVDPEVTLQFLRSAVYYFLTDSANSQYHLEAIKNILDFTDAEKSNINKGHFKI